MDIGGVGARQYRYNYYVNNVLANINAPAGATVFTFTYGARGNLYSKNSQIYDFDSGNRLTSVLGKENYKYDGLGRRVYAADTVATVWQYAQDGRELWNLDARRQQNRINIYLGNTVLATRTMDWGTGAITVRYLHTDALGSPVAETDATGALTKRNSYEPYGAQYGTPNIDGIGYTGHVMDLATGLTYIQQRYYDPQVGRFLSSDPAQSEFNRYDYAANNPYRFTDPDGRYTCEGEACQSAATGLAAIQKAIGNSSNSTKGHAALVAAKNFYGTRDSHNGVHFETKQLEAGTTAQAITSKDSSEPGGFKTSIQVDLRQLGGIAEVAGVSLGDFIGEKMAHESVHGNTQRHLGGMLRGWSALRADEVRAWTVTALFDSGAKINPWGLLTPQGQVDAEVVGDAAERSTNKACEIGWLK